MKSQWEIVILAGDEEGAEEDIFFAFEVSAGDAKRLGVSSAINLSLCDSLNR